MESRRLLSRLITSANLRKNPGIPSQAGEWSLLAAIFLGSLLVRVPFRSSSLVNWDSVNFALGTQAFDLAHHQPHPPGYIGYVVLGSALNYVTGNPITSLTLVSMIAGAVASVMLFLLACRFMARRYASIVTVLFSLSPVMWYYSEVPLTYSVEVALALTFLWTGHKALGENSFTYLITATLLLALLGAVRQTGAILLLPLWLYILWTFPWAEKRQALAVLTVGNLMWLVPLFWMSGGPVNYLEESAKLTGAVVTPLSVFTLSMWGLLRNITFVALGFLIGVNLALVPIVIAHRRGYNPVARLLKQERAFILLWITPALVVYLLVHTGQLGYILLVLPAAFLCAGIAMASLARRVPDLKLNRPRKVWLGLQNLPVGLAVIGVLFNFSAFLFLPGVIYSVAGAEAATLVDNLAITASGGGEGLTRARARQYDLKRNNAHWKEIVGFIHRFDPEATAILAVPDGAGSYRHLAYYLPEYQVYGLGKDRSGRFGHLMTAQGGEDTYTIDGLDSANLILSFPDDTERIIIPDPGIFEHLEMPHLPSHKLTLNSGAEVLVAQVPPGSILYTLNTGETTPEYFLRTFSPG